MANVINIGGGAGGSGSSVVANPQGAATDTLVKLGIEGTIYDFAGSGGGSSGDYIHELLWDYVNDNSGTIPFGTYSVTLAESIDKYDCISMCFKSLYSDAGNWGQCTLFLIDVNALKTNPMHANYFNYTSFGERSSAFYLSGKTLQKIIDGTENTNGLVAVYGIKYGGNNIKYSTDEHVVGTWIDGKTLYEKTIAVTQGSSETYISLSGLDIDTFFVESAFIQSSGSGDVTPTTYFVTSGDKFMYYYNRTNDRLVIQNAWQGSGYITIRYTKAST